MTFSPATMAAQVRAAQQRSQAVAATATRPAEPVPGVAQLAVSATITAVGIAAVQASDGWVGGWVSNAGTSGPVSAPQASTSRQAHLEAVRAALTQIAATGEVTGQVRVEVSCTELAIEAATFAAAGWLNTFLGVPAHLSVLIVAATAQGSSLVAAAHRLAQDVAGKQARPAGPEQETAPVGGAAGEVWRPQLADAVGVAANRTPSGAWMSAWVDDHGASQVVKLPAELTYRDSMLAAVHAAARAAEAPAQVGVPVRPLLVCIGDQEIVPDLAAVIESGWLHTDTGAPVRRTVQFLRLDGAANGFLAGQARRLALHWSNPPRAFDGADPDGVGRDGGPGERMWDKERNVAVRPLVVATDGSKGSGAVGAWAFVTEAGRHKQGTCTGQILAVELTAIAEALGATPADRPLVLLVDSTDAIHAVQGAPAARERGWQTEDGRPVSHRRLLKEIVRAMAGRQVELRWVRGHGGDPLNDAADRLAVLARRCHEARSLGVPMSAQVTEKVIAGVLADLREGLAARPVTEHLAPAGSAAATPGTLAAAGGRR